MVLTRSLGAQIESLKRINEDSGVLIVDKPKGMVSKDVSRLLERRFGKCKLGHVGTLDPLASGILPLLFNKATKLQDQLLAYPKTYEFDFELGVETETLDSESPVLRRMDVPSGVLEALKSILSRFKGPILQTPNVYSAIKYQGKPLYEYAREAAKKAGLSQTNVRDLGIPLDALQRNVVIHDLEVLRVEGSIVSMRVCCGKGTYVRCLARDLAKEIGTVATVTHLRRVQASGFFLHEAVPLSAVMEADNLAPYLVPLEEFGFNATKWRPKESMLNELLKGTKVSVSVQDFQQGLQPKRFVEEHSSDLDSVRFALVDRSGEKLGFGYARREGVTMAVQLGRGVTL